MTLPTSPPLPSPILRRGRDIFTTGMVASLCGISPKQAAALCDDGRLKCHRLPGCPTRRIVKADLVAFCKRHGYRDALAYLAPPSALLVGLPSAMASDTVMAARKGEDIVICLNLLAAGRFIYATCLVLCAGIDVLDGCTALHAIRWLASDDGRASFPACPRVIAVLGEDGSNEVERYARAGCDDVLAMPVSGEQLAEAIRRVTR